MATNNKTNTTAKATTDKDKAKMEREIAELKEQIAELMAMSKRANETPAQPKATQEVKPQKKTIRFTNLCLGGLTLKGTRTYRIEKQFDTVQIPLSEAMAIVSNMPNALASGIVFIEDKDFVEEMGMGDVYEKILDENGFKTLLDKTPAEICDIYETLSEKQKIIVINMVKDDLENGKQIDANILFQLGKKCGVDFLGSKIEEDTEEG